MFTSIVKQFSLWAMAACLVVLCCALAMPGQAHAALATAAASAPTNKVITFSEAAQDKIDEAFDRAYEACMNYKSEPDPIVVDMSDLKLSEKQATEVWNRLHTSGELFWVNCYGDTYTKKKFTLPCYYDDATITKMRKKLNTAADKALKRIGPGMTAATKVHMLHDYLIDIADYPSAKETKSASSTSVYKTAYSGLVGQGGSGVNKADCFGFALAMDVLLYRAGFQTDIALNESLDHAWNLVEIGSSWFHVDAGWDNGFTGQKWNDANFNWEKVHCHLYLLQSDASMIGEKKTGSSGGRTYDPDTQHSIMSHQGWTCHHKCTNTKYDNIKKTSGSKGSFNKSCAAYKSIVRSFTCGGVKYTVTGVNKVQYTKVTASKQKAAKSLTVPATVKYKNVTYKVYGIGSKAFAAAKAKTLSVKSPYFSKGRVKSSLTGSKVTKVKLAGDAKKKKANYKQYFAKANSGKKVTVA